MILLFWENVRFYLICMYHTLTWTIQSVRNYTEFVIYGNLEIDLKSQPYLHHKWTWWMNLYKVYYTDNRLIIILTTNRIDFLCCTYQHFKCHLEVISVYTLIRQNCFKEWLEVKDKKMIIFFLYYLFFYLRASYVHSVLL